MNSTRKPVFWIFFICWLGLVADGYDLYVYGATLPGIIGPSPFGVTTGAAGAVGSFALVGMLLGSLVVGTLTDRLGRRRIFISALALFSVAMLACSLAPSWEVFAAFRFVACFGIGGLLPTAVALTNEFAAPGRKSLTLGFVLTAPAIGTVLASLTSLALLESSGFRPVYAVGAAGLLLIPFAYLRLPESPSFLRARGREAEAARIEAHYSLTPASEAPVGSAEPTSPVRALVSRQLRRPTLTFWAVTFLSLLTIFGVSTWLPQIMRSAGYGIGSSVSFLLAYSVGAVIGTVVGSGASQKFGPKPLAIAGFVSAAVALLLLSLNPPSAVVMILTAVAGFGGLGTQNMINDYIAQYYPAAVRATGLGWALAIGRVGAIVGPTYGALLVSGGGGVPVAAAAFAVPAVIGAAFMFTLPSKTRTQSPTPAAQPVA
ncbi:aromatic acid/H+ symport family MFS transporter [Pseudarthrobacter phenanthrenivorans]|uniref:Arabinose efflux permease family protein n=1 Tax=Pseudarthrobacter phenanthrenivorans (strain DSM 18606 / JCM 16027 / LMG 23796 / Sphe3) TaxID=930171 RepID=F0MAH7_PSEPM|nr:MFS transporter [Pseudarthrobacter phenanthrenivorans]ADX72845.1 arabinose efflux permease family protein [Pseudarthrobacter phenanthrenivorans Sphe3]TPV53499.1 aromatic acid/H+ symport family MFS transporter [Pseudarthrobacter phenanthrenivorans]